jgi:hypothetical protein
VTCFGDVSCVHLGISLNKTLNIYTWGISWMDKTVSNNVFFIDVEKPSE